MARPRNRLPVVWLQTIQTDGELVRARLRWTTKDGREDGRSLGWIHPDRAEDERAAAEAKLRLGLTPTTSTAVPATGGVTVRDVLVQYGADLQERHVGGEGYRTNVRNRSVPLLAHLGRLLVGELRTRDLERYVSARREEIGGRRRNRLPKRATVQDEIRLLRRAMETTRRWGLHRVEFPGAPSWKGWPDDAKPARRLTSAELALLIDVANLDRPELGRLLGFIAYCPRRPVAIFALTRADSRRALDAGYDGNDLLYFSRDKGGVSRGWSPLLPQARAVLVEHLAGTLGPPAAPVWTTATGLPYTANRLASALRYLATKAKVAPVTPYDLRKFGAVEAYRATGRSLKAACRFTGHKDPAVLLRNYLFDEEDAVTRAVRGEADGT